MGIARNPTTLEPLDEGVDHVRGEARAPVILEYGDYECPYSRQAFRSIERVVHELAGGVRFGAPNDVDPMEHLRGVQTDLVPRRSTDHWGNFGATRSAE